MRDGWEIKTIGDLCVVLDKNRKPISKRDRVPGPYPYYGASCVQDYVNGYLFDGKYLLIGEDGAKWGAGDDTAYIVEGKFWVNNHAHIVKAKDGFLEEYLYYYLKFLDLYPIVAGAVIPKLTQDKLISLEIPIPPYEEQKRIVGLLDLEFAKINALKNNSERIVEEAKVLFRSALKKELTPNGSWQAHSIKDVSVTIFAGGDVPKQSLSKVQNAKYNVPIVSNGIERDGLYGYTEFAKVNVPAITISGRGTIGYIVERIEPFYPIIRLITIIPKLDQITTRFLFYSLRNEDFSHTGSSIPQLTVPMVKDKTIFVPALDKQKLVTSRLDTLYAQCKEVQDNYRQIIVLSDDLKQALLRKAFNGEL